MALALLSASPTLAEVTISETSQCARPPGADLEETSRLSYELQLDGAKEVPWNAWREAPETVAALERLWAYRDVHRDVLFGSFVDPFEQVAVLVVDFGGPVEQVADQVSEIFGDHPLHVRVVEACRSLAVVLEAVMELRSRGVFALVEDQTSGVMVQTDLPLMSEAEACELEEEFEEVGLAVFFGDAEPHGRWADCAPSSTSGAPSSAEEPPSSSVVLNDDPPTSTTAQLSLPEQSNEELPFQSAAEAYVGAGAVLLVLLYWWRRRKREAPRV